MLPSVLTVQKKNLNYDADDMSNLDTVRTDEYSREQNAMLEETDFLGEKRLNLNQTLSME